MLADTRPNDTVVLDSTHPSHPSQAHRHSVLRKKNVLRLQELSQFSTHLPPPAVHSVEVEAGHEESHIPVGGVRVRPGVDLLLVLTETVQQRFPVTLRQSNLSACNTELVGGE